MLLLPTLAPSRPGSLFPACFPPSKPHRRGRHKSQLTTPTRVLWAAHSFSPAPAPPNSPVAGFHATSNPSLLPDVVLLCGRISRHTVCPSLISASTKAVPTSPVEPVTKIFISSSAEKGIASLA